MNKINNLWFAAVLPFAYATYKYCNDKQFKKKVDTGVNKSIEYINENAHKFSHRVTNSEDSVKQFFKDNYEKLNLNDSQIKDIEQILGSKFEATKKEIHKLLSDDQKHILDGVKKVT